MATVESPQGTAIPPEAAPIFDALGADWTLRGGKVYRRGVATLSSGVNLMLYWNHIVYHRNTTNHWYKWNNAITVGNSWQLTTNPKPAPAPSLPVGETRVDFYDGDKLINSTKLVPDGS